MFRHRRHFSLDSPAPITTLRSPTVSSIRGSYTLQSSPTAAGLRTARLTAHTSPLALAPAISTPLSPICGESVENILPRPSSPSSASSTDEYDDADMDDEMERMVSSVVNSPTELEVAAFAASPNGRSSVSQLGLGLPSTLQERHNHVGNRRWTARASSHRAASRSLIGVMSAEDPKLNMGMRAAFGNYRKRFLSIQTAALTGTSADLGGGAGAAISPAPITVTVSPASPTSSGPSAFASTPQVGHAAEVLVSPTNEVSTPKTSSLLSPPQSPEEVAEQQRSIIGQSPALAATRTGAMHGPHGHRRAVSAGSLPSLDQIREWSQRRHVTGVPSVSPVKTVITDEGYNEEETLEVLASHIAKPAAPCSPLASPEGRRENRLDRVLKSRPNALLANRIRSTVGMSASVPCSPVVNAEKEDGKRVECARQMVNVLGKRRSMTAMRFNAIAA